MKLNPYLNFNGQCAEAFALYEQCIGGKIEMMQTHGESPMKDRVPPAWHGKILHAAMAYDGQLLMGSDVPPDRYEAPQGFAVSITVTREAEGQRIFQALGDRGKITMPFQPTFWSPGFGMLVDRFGIPWIVNTANPVA